MKLREWEHHEVDGSRVTLPNGWGYVLVYQWMPSEDRHDPQWHVNDGTYYVIDCETEDEARRVAEGQWR